MFDLCLCDTITANVTTHNSYLMPTSKDKKQVLTALAASKAPMDSYAMAKATGLTAMESGRVLMALHEANQARCLDELGTLNDLCARFEPVV